MGVRNLAAIAGGLIAAGRRADEPAAIVERGTLARPARRPCAAGRDRRAAAAEAMSAHRRSRSSATSPRSTSPGSRPARSPDARSRSRGRGRRRARWRRGCARSARRSSRRRRSGSSRSPPSCPTSPATTCVCLTSPNGVARLFELRPRRARARRAARRRDRARAPRRRCASTASSPTSCPSAPSPRGSSRRSPTCRCRRALLPAAEQGRDVLPDALRERGASRRRRRLPDRRRAADADAREAALGADDLVFASASAVTALHAAAGTLAGPRIVSIGPATSAALRELGYEPALEATEHTPDGLVQALLGADRARAQRQVTEPARTRSTVVACGSARRRPDVAGGSA